MLRGGPGRFFQWSREGSTYDQVVVLNHTDSRINLEHLLDGLSKRLAPDAQVELSRCYVSPDVLGRLVRSFTDVDLFSCVLLPGWWDQGGADAKCAWLRIDGGVAAKAPTGPPAFALWPSLKSLYLDEGAHNERIYVYPQDDERLPSPPSKYSSCFPEVARALWGPNIRSLYLSRMSSTDFVTKLPLRPKLVDLDISMSPLSEGALGWIVQHRNLRNLDLSWNPGTCLDLSQLGRLKKLKSLAFCTDNFTDDDFEVVAQYTSIGHFGGNGCGALTPRSWRVALSMPSLRSLWFTHGMVEGPLPEDLPEETGLRRAYAINVARRDVRALREAFRRYPNLVIEDEGFFPNDVSEGMICGYCS